MNNPVERRPRPKRWTTTVIYYSTFFEKDCLLRLLEVREEYRRRQRVNKKLADRYARNVALLSVGAMIKEGFVKLVCGGLAMLIKAVRAFDD